jgi:hypothetical protein
LLGTPRAAKLMDGFTEFATVESMIKFVMTCYLSY